MVEVRSLVASGKFDEALPILEASVHRSPHDGALQVLKGVAQFALGDVEGAEATFQQALATGLQTSMEAWRNLASICYRARRFEEAIKYVVDYRAYRPREWDAFSLHLTSLVELQRYAEAEVEILRFMEVFPDDSRALVAMMSCLGLQYRYFELLSCTSRCPSVPLFDPQAARSVAMAFAQMGLLEAAEELAISLEARPVVDEAAKNENARMARYIRALVAMHRHQFEEAIELFKTSLSPDDMSSGLFSLSIACLASGRYAEGWNLYRARASLFSMRSLEGLPFWDGIPVQGKRVLVQAEQGVGDVIQFLRFLPKLEAMGVSVVFNTYPDILTLLANSPSAREVYAPEVILSRDSFDFQSYLMDLPAMIGTETVDDIPAKVPYLFADPVRAKDLSSQFNENEDLKIGLVWAGNPDHAMDHHRSARLEDFESLNVLPGITWVLLQKGAGEKEGLCPPDGMRVMRCSDQIADFGDTAAIIENLDLVLSVDTSVAHLAGAMGKPVWILLSEEGKDWRWFCAEGSSPWYPTAKLITRRSGVNWSSFVRESVRPEIAAWYLDNRSSSKSGRWQIALVRWLTSELSAPLPPETDLLAADDIDHVWPLARARAREQRDPSLLSLLRERFPEHVPLAAAAAEWLSASGRKEEAKELWTTLLNQSAQAPVFSFLGLGGIFHDSEAFEDARKVWSLGQSAHPESARILYMAGRTEQWAGLRDTAIRYYESALSLSPRFAEAHNNRGVLYEHDAPNMALRCYQMASLYDCAYAKPWQNAARVMLRQKAGKVAAAIMKARCNVDESIGARMTYARALLEAGERDAALVVLRGLENVEDERLDADALIDKAFLCRELGDFDRCGRLLQHVVERFPSSRPGRFFYGWYLLSVGQSRDGWRYYADGCDKKATVIPEWCGEDLEGKSLVVYQDQGMGDLFQFVHLVRDLPSGAKVTLAVSDAALQLMKYQRFPCAVLPSSMIDWKETRFDFQIAQMKLPHCLSIDTNRPPRPLPYLNAPRGLLHQWQKVCGADSRLKVGIVWAGNPKYLNDSNRSSRLKDWLPLFDLEGVSIYNLQKDAAANQAFAWETLQINNIARDCDSWEKTASAVGLLDMVISVDTGVAHLSACLGKQTWILLPSRGVDYRWQLGREDVPWYPTARLFRQAENESWGDVLLRVKDVLARCVLPTYHSTIVS